jgi:hypothetical protein
MSPPVQPRELLVSLNVAADEREQQTGAANGSAMAMIVTYCLRIHLIRQGLARIAAGHWVLERLMSCASNKGVNSPVLNLKLDRR